MKKWTWKRGLAVMLGLVVGIQAPLSGFMPVQTSYAYTARSAVINASSLNVRSGPGTSYSRVAKLARGTSVTVIDETSASDGRTWYQIRFTGSGGTALTGYVLNTYIRFPVSYSHDTDFESYLNSQGFPESYKPGLRQLHAQHPSWVFVAQNTGLDWNTVIENESVLGRNLVHTGSISSYKSLQNGAYNWDNGVWTGFDGSTWVAASEDIIRYYMDPRNFLDEVSVFQFLDQTYDASLHTRDGLQSMLNGTFMEGTAGGSGGSSSGSVSGGGFGGPGSSGGPGASAGSSSSGSGGPGFSGGSGNSSVTSQRPVISGGSSQQPSGDSSQPQAGSGVTSAVPGGQGAVVVQPGSGNNSQNGVSFTAPTSGASDVQLIAPQASVSQKETWRVGTGVISAGPGAAPGSSGSGSSTPGSNTVSRTEGGQSYADILMQAASQSGVNPYVLAAMIIQEQGSDGRGNCISGNYAGYSGYYNHFNVGAYASDGMSAVERGLWYASQSGNYGRPWNSIYSSIVGGAQFYGNNYVKAGQDTLYLKKFNVQGSNMYKHQYMTNIDGASAEGSLFAEGFSTQLKATALEFKIPVYRNMPETACARPTRDGSPNNKLNGLGANGFVLTPTFNKNTESYDLIVDHSVSDVTIYANAIDGKARISGAGNIRLQSGVNEIPITVQAENGDQRTYVIHIVRQSNGPTYNAGIGTNSSPVTGGSNSSGGPGSGTVNGGPGAVSSGSVSGGASVSGTPSQNPSSGSSNNGVTYNAPTMGGSTVTLIGPGG